MERIHRESLAEAIAVSIQRKDIRISSDKMEYGFLLPNGKTIITETDEHEEAARLLLRKAGIDVNSIRAPLKVLFSYLTNSVKIGIWNSDGRSSANSMATLAFISQNTTTEIQWQRITEHIKRQGFIDPLVVLENVYSDKNGCYSFERIYFCMTMLRSSKETETIDKHRLIAIIPTPTLDMCARSNMTARDIPSVRFEIEQMSNEAINKLART